MGILVRCVDERDKSWLQMLMLLTSIKGVAALFHASLVGFLSLHPSYGLSYSQVRKVVVWREPRHGVLASSVLNAACLVLSHFLLSSDKQTTQLHKLCVLSPLLLLFAL